MTSRRRFLGSLAGGLALPTLSGCGYRPGGGDIRWQRASPRGLDRPSTAAVTGGLLVTVAHSRMNYDPETDEFSRGGRVIAYGVDDGAQRWRVHLDAGLSCHAVGDGGVAVGLDETVATLRDGREQWRVDAGGPLSTLAVADGTVYALTEDRSLVACADGSVRWRRELSTSESDSAAVDVAAGPELAVVRVDGTVTAFAPDGATRWTRSDVIGGRELAAVDGDVFVGTSSRPAVLAADSGETRWVGDDGTDRVAVTDGAVYQSVGGELVASDRSGQRRWSVGGDWSRPRTDRRGRPKGIRFASSVVADADGVFAVTADGIAAVEPADGSVRWRTRHVEHLVGLSLAESGVLAVTDDDLVCYYRKATA